MFPVLVFLFVTVPLLELYLLLQVGGMVGPGPTLALVIGTGILGAWLARLEGLRTARAIRAELEAGKLPAARLTDAALILAAGLLLLTPGILTDLAGFALLAPPVRALVRRGLAAALARHLHVEVPPRDPEVIDVEWSEEPPDDGPRLGP